MNLTLRHSLALAIAASTLSVPASAAVITFDDLPHVEDIQSPYQGFTWDYWTAINGDLFGDYGSNGYTNGVVSGPNVACACANDFSQSAQSISSASSFTLGSGYFTSGWNDGATLQVTGFDGADTLYTTSAVLNMSGPSLLVFNWSGIDKVTFSISGGTRNPNVTGTGNYFALDNLTITPGDIAPGVPEPKSWALMIAGFGLVGFALRRRVTALA